MTRLLFLFYCISQIFTSAHADISLLEQKVRALVQSRAGDTNIGIYVVDLNTNSPKFSLHEHRKFIPASTAKLFTTYAALHYLGPEYKINTIISSNSHVNRDGILASNLYIKFNGDPTFKYEDLSNIFKQLELTQITGNIIINRSIFDDNTTAPGGFTWDNKPFYYAAPKSAAIINKNCSEAWMEPGVIGKSAKLEITDPTLLTIVNNVTTSKVSSAGCPFKSRYLGNNTYEVYGCMFDNIKTPVRLNFALQDNTLMVQEYIKKALNENGIQFKGKLKVENSEGKYALYKHQSPPVKDLLIDVLRNSCNLTSSALFKHMAAVYSKGQGSDEEGEIMMKAFLAKHGIGPKDFKIKDGAGESRYNLVTPFALTKILTNMYNDKSLRDYITELLPQYGLNGTVKYRHIKGPCLNCDVYAKTGTLQNHSSLTGLYLPEKGNKIAFAIMINNHGLSTGEVKSLEDDILHLLLAN